MVMAKNTPAQVVIERFGGTSKLAHLLGIQPQAISQWHLSPKYGGTGGAIPRQRIKPIMSLAKKHNVTLTLEELIYGA